MASCEKQQKVWELHHGALARDELREIQEHLKECVDCRAFVHETESLEEMLAKRKRPQPSPELLNTYHRELRVQFGPQKNCIQHRMTSLVSKFMVDPSRLMRFAPALGMLVVGLMLGVWIARSDRPALESTHVVVVPVEQAEHRFVTHFFGETELWMHQMLDHDTTLAGILRIQSLSRQLLNQLRLIHDRPWVTQDTDLVNYLTELEMMLMDLCNSEITEADTAMANYQETIKAWDFLFRNERLRQRVTQLSMQI